MEFGTSVRFDDDGLSFMNSSVLKMNMLKLREHASSMESNANISSSITPCFMNPLWQCTNQLYFLNLKLHIGGRLDCLDAVKLHLR